MLFFEHRTLRLCTSHSINSCIVLYNFVRFEAKLRRLRRNLHTLRTATMYLPLQTIINAEW